MAKSNCPAEDSAPPQASAGQLTPRFLPLTLSGRLLQVTVAISPSAAKGASKGTVFCAHPIGRSPQTNAGFRKVGERGASAAKEKFKLSGSSVWTSGRGLAVRFGAASRASLVIEFCLLGGCYLLAESFFPLYVFAGWGWVAFCRRSSPLSAFFNAAFAGGPSVLRKPENSEAPFRNFLSARGYGWLR